MTEEHIWGIGRPRHACWTRQTCWTRICRLVFQACTLETTITPPLHQMGPDAYTYQRRKMVLRHGCQRCNSEIGKNIDCKSNMYHISLDPISHPIALFWRSSSSPVYLSRPLLFFPRGAPALSSLQKRFWEKNSVFYENTWVGWGFEETVAGIRDPEPFLQSPIWCKFFIFPSFQVLLDFEQPTFNSWLDRLTWSWIQGCLFQLQRRNYDLCPVANNPWFVHRLLSGR